MDNLVIESLKFMVLGMGIVYLLLALIVFLVGLQHKIVEKYFPDKPKAEAAPKKGAKKQSSSKEDEAVVAAIVAAVAKFRKN